MSVQFLKPRLHPSGATHRRRLMPTAIKRTWNTLFDMDLCMHTSVPFLCRAFRLNDNYYCWPTKLLVDLPRTSANSTTRGINIIGQPTPVILSVHQPQFLPLSGEHRHHLDELKHVSKRRVWLLR